MFKNLNSAGFTIVELLVATGIISLVLVSIISGITFSISNSRYSQEKALSVRYAQEGLEWVRAQRDLRGWGGFMDEISLQGEVTFCLNQITEDTSLAEQMRQDAGSIEPCYTDSIEGKFDRSIVMTRVADHRIDLVSTVTWNQGEEMESTILKTSLYQWR